MNRNGDANAYLVAWLLVPEGQTQESLIDALVADVGVGGGIMLNANNW